MISALSFSFSIGLPLPLSFLTDESLFKATIRTSPFFAASFKYLI